MLMSPRRAPDGALADFEYTFINAAGARLVGRTPDRVVGRGADEVFPMLRPTGLWEACRAVLETGVPFEQEVAYPYDGVVASAYHVTAVRVGDGLAMSFADVTERAAALAAAEQARADAEAANTAKAQFLANMSHELRTPLNAIGGYAQLLDMGLHGPVTEAQRAALTRVTRAQQHLLGLINDVLNYAKLESGRVEYALEPVDVRDVVAEVAPLVEPQVTARGLAFAVDVPPSARPVWADREKLRQILLNLLGNAVKFTEPGGHVALDVGLRPDGSQPDDLVFVRVRDTGVGIPRDKQDAIFEPFVQVRSGYAQATEGTGLGLAISRDLARGMGGDLRVRSAPGRGSAFTLSLRTVTTADGRPVDRRAGDERREEDARRSGDDRRAASDALGATGPVAWEAVVWEVDPPGEPAGGRPQSAGEA
jgi:signal transduction histidine kinase